MTLCSMACIFCQLGSNWFAVRTNGGSSNW